MTHERVLEAWEFGDPVDVVARREAIERSQATAKRRQVEQRMNQRRIKALVKQVMAKARAA
jgi:hypothetical protein